MEKGPEAVACGLATHLIPSDQLVALRKDLEVGFGMLWIGMEEFHIHLVNSIKISWSWTSFITICMLLKYFLCFPIASGPACFGILNILNVAGLSSQQEHCFVSEFVTCWPETNSTANESVCFFPYLLLDHIWSPVETSPMLIEPKSLFQSNMQFVSVCDCVCFCPPRRLEDVP